MLCRNSGEKQHVAWVFTVAVPKCDDDSLLRTGTRMHSVNMWICPSIVEIFGPGRTSEQICKGRKRTNSALTTIFRAISYEPTAYSVILVAITSRRGAVSSPGRTRHNRFRSGMGNAGSHSNRNLPLVLAGGGFRHGEHKSFFKDEFGRQATSAANLFVSMLQKFGVETDRFGLSSGTLTGLEVQS